MSQLAYAIGARLNGQRLLWTGNTIDREMNCVESFYLNNKTIWALTGVGILVGGAGVLALLMSMSHLPALVTFLHAGSISNHVMWITGVTATSMGGATALTHGVMMGFKKYADHRKEKEPSVYY